MSTPLKRDELIEAAAKALFENDEKYKGRRWEFASDRLKNIFRSDARAAASIIIEACAKWVEEFPARYHGHLPIDPHEVAAQVALEIAAGIRALAPVKEG